MKNIIYIIIVWQLLLPGISLAGETGSICIGPNLSVVGPEDWRKDHVFVKVEDLPPFPFEFQQRPTVVLRNLDTGKKYAVKILAGEEVIKSWILDFKALRTKMVQIWRSKGYWRMKAVKGELCN